MQDVRDERECCGFLMTAGCPMLKFFFGARSHTLAAGDQCQN